MAIDVEEILGNIQGALMSFGAERSPSLVNFIGVGTCCAMGAVTGKCLHHVHLIVTWGTGIGGGEIKVDLSNEGWHGDWIRWLER